MPDARKRLEERLSRPIKTAGDAELAARAADALAAYLRADEQAELALGHPGTGTQVRGARSFSGLRLQDAAELVLEQAGAPLHAKELGRRIKAGGWSHPRTSEARPDLIVYQLAARLPREPARFERVAPNTFGLARWRNEERKPRRRPRVALFEGDRSDTARLIGESADEAAARETWRSS